MSAIPPASRPEPSDLPGNLETAAPSRRRISKKHVIGYAATALVALGAGAASQSSSAQTPTAAPVTVTAVTTVTAQPAAETAVHAGVTTPVRTVTVTAPAVTVTPPAPAPESVIGGDGLYQVGVDIMPGTYVSRPSPDGNCYYARLKGSDSMNDIIDNGNSSGQVVIVIKKTDKFFESTGCSDWTKR